ncbi:MAG: cell division protein ZipA, partial [Oceanospirillaceae bacterium]
AEENDHLTEIEILKARLKELAPQELVQSVQTSELNESVIVNRVDSFDERFEARAEQIDQQAADNLTTVIDDDVSLEDLNSEISIQNLDSLNPNSADSLEQSTAKMISQPDLDQSADPLMDGFQNSVATNDLMSQFEHDLKQDGQAVANELDLPITEIIKKNKAAPAELPAINEGTLDASTSSGFDHSQVDSNQQNHFESDPLFDNNMLSESVLSGDDFDDDQQDTALNNNELSINEGDNLGFTALEQGYDNDPLMSGFDKRESEFKEEQQDSLEDKLPSQKKPLIENDQDSEQASYQESLFIEPEAVNSIQTPAKVAKTSRKVIANVEDPNAVLIVTVVAKDQYLNGAVLRHVVEACGMEFGDMKVFHRFEDGADQGAVQFSMANAINPGTFNIDDMDDTATPGVSFFMSMDEPIDPKKAFECMIATAETVATHLNGDLLDDDRSVIRPQTKEHYRERVRIHEMNKLRRRAL